MIDRMDTDTLDMFGGSDPSHENSTSLECEETEGTGGTSLGEEVDPRQDEAAGWLFEKEDKRRGVNKKVQGSTHRLYPVLRQEVAQ